MGCAERGGSPAWRLGCQNPAPPQPHLRECTVVPHLTQPQFFLQHRTRVLPEHQYPVWCEVQKLSPHAAEALKFASKLVFCQPGMAGLGLSASFSLGTSSYG